MGEIADMFWEKLRSMKGLHGVDIQEVSKEDINAVLEEIENELLFELRKIKKQIDFLNDVANKVLAELK